MHPHSLQFWVAFGVAGLGIWTVIGLGVLAARAVVRRVLPARVAVDAGGLTVGDGRAARRIAREDIERVDPGEASAVMVALRTGRAIRLRFSPDRPVVERDDFIARVHTIMAEPAIATYPAAETSGVRVAFRAEGTAIEEEADAAKPLARARRR